MYWWKKQCNILWNNKTGTKRGYCYSNFLVVMHLIINFKGQCV